MDTTVRGGGRRAAARAALAALLPLVLAAGCAPAGPTTVEAADPAGAPPVWLTILHTNDHQGHAWPFPLGGCQDVGGLAAQATLVRRIRAEAAAEGRAVLLVSAGDVNSGWRASDLLEARPDFAAMAAIGYDAMACGNHEFDGTAARYERQLREAGFPILCANVVRRADGSVAGQEAVTIERGGLRIGVVGVLTDEAPWVSNPDLWRETYELRPAVETAARHGERLARDHDVVIALAHLGWHEPTAAAEPELADSLTLARRTGVFDVIIDGHTHTVLPRPVREGQSLIVQAGDIGRYVGRLDIAVAGGAVVDWRYELLPVNAPAPQSTECPTERIPPDESIAALLQGFLAEGGAAGDDEVVCVVERRLEGEAARIRSEETNLGDLAADAVREAVGAEVALLNAGSLRRSLEVGPVTQADVHSLSPFPNHVVRGTVTGRTLLAALEQSASRGVGTGGFLHVSGLRLEIEAGKVLRVTVGGEPLAPDQRYTLATSSFLLGGGDGYGMLADVQAVTDSGLTLAAVLLGHLRRLGTVRQEVDGRILRR